MKIPKTVIFAVFALSLCGAASAHDFGDAACYKFQHVGAKRFYESFDYILANTPDNMRNAMRHLLAFQGDRLTENFGACPNAAEIKKVTDDLHHNLSEKYPHVFP